MKDFYFGAFTTICALSAYQDMLGKEKYLERVNELWIDTSVYMWLAFWFLGFGIRVYLIFKESE